jgi:hypothetical protein
VSGAAVRCNQKKSKAPYWGAINESLREEPTWGDVDVLARLIPRLECGNQAVLSAAFSNSSSSAKALQAIRNAAAHMHAQSFQQVLDIRSRYVSYPITHPVQALFWLEPTTNDFLVTAALEDLRSNALVAVS